MDALAIIPVASGPSPHGGGYDVNAYPIRKTYRDEATGTQYEVGIYPGEACLGEDDLERSEVADNERRKALTETRRTNNDDDGRRDLATAH